MAETPPEPTRERKPSKLVSLLAIAAMLVVIAAVVGFFRFTAALERQVQVPGSEADAIVVLTGATGRIKAGLELLRKDQGKRLLISGVYPATTSKQLIDATKTSKDLFACCVDLGKTAQDTIGNAKEAAEWATKHKYKSLILVTSSFHMPRTLIEFGNAMPGLKLVPYPVKAPAKKWWADSRTAALFVSEYSKLILAWVRTGLFPGTSTSRLANSGGV
ncbi:MAG: YdcF family protein [Pseudomonadota bacterium]